MILLYNHSLISSEDKIISANNEAFTSANTVFQDAIIVENTWLFWEEVYFNLMANLRKMRMNIPLTFTMDFFKDRVEPYLNASNNYQIRFQIFPENNTLSVLTSINSFSNRDVKNYSIDVFKEIKILPGLLSSVSNPKMENIVGKKYAEENDLADILFLNNDLNVARTIFGNVYYLFQENIYTNGTDDGAYRQAIDQVFYKKNHPKIVKFSAFELQKADEVFILSEKWGIISVTNFRKKEYATEKAKMLWTELIQ